jgi:hypothetical protein
MTGTIRNAMVFRARETALPLPHTAFNGPLADL